jgi:hypothetical protein
MIADYGMAYFSSVLGFAGRAAAAGLAALAAAPAARAESIKATYSLSLIGISIGQASAEGVIEGRNYRLAISMRTSGLASLVNDTRGAATAAGALSQHDGPLPTSYANTTANRYETRTVRMSLSGNAVRAVQVEPVPWDMPIRIPVSDTNKSHITDPLTALLMHVPQNEPLIGPSACNRTIPVFDGVTRFDVTLAYVETRTVEAHGYVGPVSVCAARYRPIAGHRPDSASTRFMAENDDITVWLAPLPSAHVVVPYRIDMRTTVGHLVVEAAEFRLGGRKQASDE